MKSLLYFLTFTTLCFGAPSCLEAQTVQPFGAVVFYGAPPESSVPSGEAFSAATEGKVLAIAVQSCKANTVKGAWGNCAEGRWLQTGSELLVAAVCDAKDSLDDPHKLLWFLKDGVTASDEEIRAAVLRENISGTIAEGGCRKVAVFDKTKPARNEAEDSLVARSVAKDKAN